MGKNQDGNGKSSRRTYLKGAAATGVALSLAGCISLAEQESTVMGLNPDWADSAGYVPADYQREQNEYQPERGEIVISPVTVISHAVVYDREEQSGPTAGFGTFTTPIPTSWIGRHYSVNPYWSKSIQELIENETTGKALLEGLGVDVGSEVSWEEINHEELDAGTLELYETTANQYLLTDGILVTGDERREVLLLIGKAELDGDVPLQVLFGGASLERSVTEGEGSASLREEYGQQIRDDLDSPIANLEEIDPDADLPGLE